ncbi:unnamed protein product [Didymodactylos carnosus]|uniref:Transmembrane protein n=1 Tax=Didymodactylos carnosus TaxID=1234261 RepID=A0A815XIH0_9BILA|nr:unnamed protein product [Didymodactylos carnosus]CAF4419440.1 unnamed protein product [Didymodactylos carnosus]
MWLEQPSHNTVQCRAVRAVLKRVKHAICTFNIFKQNPPIIDEHKLKDELIGTRLFVILLIVSLVVLVLYTSLMNITTTITVNSPAIAQYTALYMDYSATLTCYCTTISMPYQKFISIHSTYHQVCTSNFTSQLWLDYLTNLRQTTVFDHPDFRNTGAYSFQTLVALCALTNETISNNLVVFNSTSFISPTVVSNKTFQLQAQSFIDLFILATKNSFSTSMKLVRDTTQGNGLMSGLRTNFIPNISDSELVIYPYKYTRDNDSTICSCSVKSTCITQSIIYNIDGDVQWYVPGMYQGCFILESLLESNLQCFYNQECVETLQSYIESIVTITPVILSNTSNSQYQPTTSIQQIIGNLMVEQWHTSILFEVYYEQCNPTYYLAEIETNRLKTGRRHLIAFLIFVADDSKAKGLA